jgi:hypothetical protein
MANTTSTIRFLDPGATRRVSGYIRATMERHKISAEAFISESGSIVDPKTLSAMFNLLSGSTRLWDIEKARVLFEYACRVNRSPFDRLWSAIVEGVSTTTPSDSEAPFKRYYHFSHRKAQELDCLLRIYQSRANLVRIFGRISTFGVMPERMVRGYLKARYADNPDFDDRVLEGIRKFERKQHDAFLNNKRAGGARLERYLSDRDFFNLLGRNEPYFHLMKRDDIDKYLDDLEEAIIDGRTVFGITHGAPTQGDSAYRYLLHFESLVLIDEQVLIRHEAHKPYMTLFERQPEPFWNMTLDYRARQIGSLPRRTIHKMDIDSTVAAIRQAADKYFI